MSLLLDLASIKLPCIAHIFIYLEIIYIMEASLIPSNQAAAVAYEFIVRLGLSGLCLFCDPLPNLVFLVVGFLFTGFVSPMISYHDDVNMEAQEVFDKLVVIAVAICLFVQANVFSTSYAKKSSTFIAVK